MTWALLGAVTLVTVASRVLPMVLLPSPRGRAARVLEALPAPLFAALAVQALAGGAGAPPRPALFAAAAALLGSVRRSLGVTLVCGLAGYGIAQAIPA